MRQVVEVGSPHGTLQMLHSIYHYCTCEDYMYTVNRFFSWDNNNNALVRESGSLGKGLEWDPETFVFKFMMIDLYMYRWVYGSVLGEKADCKQSSLLTCWPDFYTFETHFRFNSNNKFWKRTQTFQFTNKTKRLMTYWVHVKFTILCCCKTTVRVPNFRAYKECPRQDHQVRMSNVHVSQEPSSLSHGQGCHIFSRL